MNSNTVSLCTIAFGLLVLFSCLTTTTASPVHSKRRHVSLMDRLGSSYKNQPETQERRRSVHKPERILPIQATFIKATARTPATQNRAHVIGFGVQTSPFERFNQKNMRSAMKNILLRMN